MKKSRRSRVRKISYIIFSAVVFLTGAVLAAVELGSLRRQNELNRERALTQLGTYMSEISTDLDKTVYVSTAPMLGRLADEIWRASAAAKLSLSEITDEQTELSSVYKFLSQAGEYTRALNAKAAAGTKTDKKDRDSLLKLRDFAARLDSELRYLTAQQQSGALTFEQVKSVLADDEDKKINFSGELYDTGEAFEGYPTLIYDGPFSDSASNEKPALTENAAPVTKAEAQKRAADFLGIKEKELYFMSKCEGDLPCFTFYNAVYTVSVTEKGGLVSYMLSSDIAGESVMNEKAAVKAAAAFLAQHGYKKVKESYYFTSDGICTVNFSYYDGGVIYYTDLIKVSVALDTGKITAFDSTGYLMNHRERKIKSDHKLTPESAKSILNPSLEVKKISMAFIPDDAGAEYYVYEYLCTSREGEDVLVYIDPDTGEERDILILLYSDGGVLTK